MRHRTDSYRSWDSHSINNLTLSWEILNNLAFEHVNLQQLEGQAMKITDAFYLSVYQVVFRSVLQLSNNYLYILCHGKSDLGVTCFACSFHSHICMKNDSGKPDQFFIHDVPYHFIPFYRDKYHLLNTFYCTSWSI